jgi:hypothetical protein
MIIEYLIVDILQLLLVGRKMLKLKEKRVHGTESSLKKTDLYPFSGKFYLPSPLPLLSWRFVNQYKGSVHNYQHHSRTCGRAADLSLISAWG